ncbi:hypothetical protein VP01_6538g2 [Puccinia sorghi]|uniref:Uncharacterized protein n=1 Tax=Puccinia sorghi TaxID=27349 RepID=A0A0L6UFG8_9BASI|nr:hypothetical protein VP01_6538g2 [Puccinia sorghi]
MWVFFEGATHHGVVRTLGIMPPKNKSNQKISTSKIMPKKATPKTKKPKKPAIHQKSQKSRVKNSSEDDATDKTAIHLKKDDYLVIINCLKIKHKYKKVHTKSISTGFGLTNEDGKAGITTINEKLEIMFPHYHEKNKLMGD